SSLSVGSLIGSGAYGAVYHAYWEGRKVAIKKFTMSQVEAARESAIQHEITVLESLRDKHIIQFYGTTEHKSRLVLVMEFAEGGSLEGVIQRGQLDWPNKSRIAQEVVRGLAYIHHKEVLHRDLKSMNVLLTRHMEVKLCDFGLAAVKVRSASKSTSSVKGTTRWMAPELFAAKPRYSTKSDMYALGMVMWEMAANCTIPFQDQLDNYTVISLVRSGEREHLPNDMPSDYRQWVERCWDQDPDKRPDASEMVTKDDVPGLDENASGRQVSIVDITRSMLDLNISLSSSDSSKKTIGAVAPPTDKVDALLSRANAGKVEAQMALAAMYETGMGVEQSDVDAFKWYLRAAAQESTEAQYKTGDFFFFGRGTEKNPSIAVYWIHQAAERGHSMAQNDLGWMFRTGFGVERHDGKALAWYLKSAEQGNAVAQYNVGSMYRNGYGVERDYSQAVSWYLRSAEQGMAEAQNHLGWMYKNGYGVDPDYRQAVSWFRKSADQGSADAQYKLGSMYEEGLGVAKDIHEAIRWYRMAASQGNIFAKKQIRFLDQPE
ncbi:hypothetical protein DFQ27_002920, partial [Actinomortierella ambigua]